MKSDAWSFVPPAHNKKLGESPFRIRGSVYAGYVKYVQKEFPGGWSTISAQINDKNIEVFLRDTIFLAASSYDIEPLMHLMRVLTNLTGTPLDKLVRQGAHGAAEADVVGKYRAQLRSTSVEDMMHRLPRMFMRYFEPCQSELVRVESANAEMRVSQLPASALGFYIWPNEGFISGALESVGARDIRFTWTAPVFDGEVEGVPVQRVHCRVTWTNPVAP